MNINSAPFGSWKSPITAQQIASGTLKFSEVKIVNGKVYWLEMRPSEKGRNVLMCWSPDLGEQELLPKDYNVRTRVHEYGGGALLVTSKGIFFVHDKDQQIYRLNSDGSVKKITDSQASRFADGCFNPFDQSLFYVMEEHGDQVVNSVVKIDSLSGEIKKISEGSDFYSNPRISPDGHSLAYISWNHPNMPWDGTELHVVDLRSGKTRYIAGGADESIADPKWSESGELYFVSDKTNWWNLYREKQKESLWSVEGEFALPQWVFGRSLIGFGKQGIFCSYVKKGSNHFAYRNENEDWQALALPFTAVDNGAVENQSAVMIASSPKTPSSIVLYDIKKKGYQTIKCSVSQPFPEDYLPEPKAIEYPSSNGRTAYGFYYPPKNRNFSGPKNGKPPLLVRCHGGPTAHVSPTFISQHLFWTSRGFAILDLNYGGSTGYGRKYRNSLKRNWGIVDVDDSINGALYCVKEELADLNRLAIDGGSAGGFTTLAAMAFRDLFKAGGDYYGVSDLEGLACDTHKFESHYLDGLIGPYPEMKKLYHERSPIYHIDKIKNPIIIFQGDEDAVVPPSQSEKMYQNLVERGIPTAYLLYKGEQHGFRKAENIQRSLEAELYFFSKIMGFSLSEKIEPVEIANLTN